MPRSVKKKVVPAVKVQPVSVPTATPPKRKKNLYIIPIVALIFGIILYVVDSLEFTAIIKDSLMIFFGMAFFLFAFISIFIILYYAIKLLIVLSKRPKIFFAVIIGVLVLGFLGWKIYKHIDYQRMKADVMLLNTNLADALDIKSIRDSYYNNTAVPTDIKVTDIGDYLDNYDTFTYDLAPNSMLDGYKNQTLSWIEKMIVAKDVKADWANIADTPDGFTISLDDGEIQEAFADSINRIIDLKEFGDLAIASGDHEAMRYIGANLEAQSYWRANDPGFLDLAVMDKVYAASAKWPAPKRTPCLAGGKICYSTISGHLVQLYRSAYGYSASPTSTTADWTGAWSELSPILAGGGYADQLAGITIGDSNGAKVSPKLQQFYDECSAKGGIVNGSGGVQTRLPSSESGYSCWYKNNTCWDKLTYSGSRYMGGDIGAGCQELNLVPKVAPNLINDTVDAFTNVFGDLTNLTNIINPSSGYDGTYTIKYNSGSCNVPGFSAATLSPFSYTIQVSGGKVYYNGSPYLSISSNGTANMNVNYSASGVTVKYTDSMAFNAAAGTVAGNFVITGNASGYGASVSVNCSGSYSGQKN